MGIKEIFAKNKSPATASSVKFLNGDDFEDIFSSGYTRLSDSPDVTICVNKIANLIASMTIFLMENGEYGDSRVKNGLSSKVDRTPYSLSTRTNFISAIVTDLLLDGNAVCLINHGVKMENDIPLLRDLIPLDYSKVRFEGDLFDYKLILNDGTTYTRENFLHFRTNVKTANPWLGTPLTVQLKDVTDNLRQAQTTKNSYYVNPRPNLIIKVDGDTDDFLTEEGKEAVEKKYFRKDQTKPLIIPTGMLDVHTISPQTLRDLAIDENSTMDKKTIAKLFNVPSYMLGIGEFTRVEYNNFIATTIMPVVKIIEQELTNKILFSPNLFFKFNQDSLIGYSFDEKLAKAGFIAKTGTGDGNEARKILDLAPRDDMNTVLALENFVVLNTTQKGDLSLKDGGVESE